MGQFDSGDDWLRRSLKACPNDVMRDIVEDAFRGDIHARASVIPKPKANQTEERPRSNNGWVEAPPVKASGGSGWAYQTEAERLERDRLEKERRDAQKLADAQGLSHEDWARMSEADLKDRQAQKEKANRDRKETPK
jgi:hypothetical protein